VCGGFLSISFIIVMMMLFYNKLDPCDDDAELNFHCDDDADAGAAMACASSS
jgi:hypothetical protein